MTEVSKCECVAEIFDFLNPIVSQTLRAHSRRFLGGDIVGDFDFDILPYATNNIFSYVFAFEVRLKNFGVRSDERLHPKLLTADVAAVARASFDMHESLTLRSITLENVELHNTSLHGRPSFLNEFLISIVRITLMKVLAIGTINTVAARYIRSLQNNISAQDEDEDDDARARDGDAGSRGNGIRDFVNISYKAFNGARTALRCGDELQSICMENVLLVFTQLINSRLHRHPFKALRDNITVREIKLSIKACSLCNSNNSLRLDVEIGVPNFHITGMWNSGSARAVLPVVLTQDHSNDCEKIIVNIQSDELDIRVGSWTGRAMSIDWALRSLGNFILTLFKPSVIVTSKHCTR